VQQLGLDKCIEEIKFRMSRYNVTPNMMQVSSRLELVPLHEHVFAI
jgi:hypothetical protein